MADKGIGDQPAQAVPNQLIDYSNRTTQANNDFQSWVKSVLTNSIADYRATAIDFGAHIFGLNGIGPLAGGTTIDEQVMSLLGLIMATDREVRKVGEDFRVAGSVGPLTGLSAIFPGSQLVKTTNAGLDAASAKAGADLASRYQTMDLATLLANLHAHSDDPNYMAAFLDNLTSDQLKQFVETYGFNGYDALPNQQATVVATLTSGFAGNLDARTAALITEYLAEVYHTNDNKGTAQNTLIVPLLTALAANPDASVNLTKALLANPNAFKLFVNGLSNTPAFDFNAGAEREVSRKLAVQILAAGSASLSAEQAQELVKLLGEDLPKGVSVGDVKELLPYISQIIGNCSALMAVRFPQTPGKNSKNLEQWADQNNKNLGYLAPYDEWIRKSIEDANQRDELLIQLGNDVLLETVFAVSDLMGPEASIPTTLGVKAFLNAATKEMLKKVLGHVAVSQVEDKLVKERVLEILKEGNIPEINADTYAATVATLAAMDPELIKHVTEVPRLDTGDQVVLLQEYRFASATAVMLFVGGKVKDSNGNTVTLSGFENGDPAALAKAIINLHAQGSGGVLENYNVEGENLRDLLNNLKIDDHTLPGPG
ncbi:hypothetical protein ABH935_001425 [Catenulispora sp. GAS73]|uniref:hypothetical protein n=1 Tax=Catenulispora sp. GAS73 TaxID=3156269 RepID=UPI003511F958